MILNKFICFYILGYNNFVKKIFIWPGILVGLYLLLQIYNLFVPCNSGMWIGGCEMGNLLIFILILTIILAYLLMTFVFLWVNKFNLKKLDVKMLVILALLSLLFLAGLLITQPGFILYLEFGILNEVGKFY